MKFLSLNILSLIILTLSSCSQQTKNQDVALDIPELPDIVLEKTDLANPEITYLTFDSTSLNCATKCVEIDLKTFYFNDAFYHQVNNRWSNIITGKSFDYPENFRQYIQDTIQKFQNANDAFKQEVPESPAYYQWFEKDTIFYAGKDHITLQRDVYQFWGGAHGMNWLHYYNIDKNGNLLDYTRFFGDTVKLKEVAEKKFRTLYAIPPESEINSTGKMFPETGFFLPKSFAVTADSVIFVYQPYEVASFAEGQHRFGLSLEELK